MPGLCPDMPDDVSLPELSGDCFNGMRAAQRSASGAPLAAFVIATADGTELIFLIATVHGPRQRRHLHAAVGRARRMRYDSFSGTVLTLTLNYIFLGFHLLEYLDLNYNVSHTLLA